MVRPLSRIGVPVLKRARRKPSRARAPLMPCVAAFAHAPAGERVAEVEQSVHEGAGAEDDGPGAVQRPSRHADAGNPRAPAPLPFDTQVLDRFLRRRGSADARKAA